MSTASKTITIRNTRRSQWFFPFEVTNTEASAAIASDGKTCIPGFKLSEESVSRMVQREKDGPLVPTMVVVNICTLAIGDARATASEIQPEVDVPAVLWEALRRDERQRKAIDGLLASGELAQYYRPVAA